MVREMVPKITEATKLDNNFASDLAKAKLKKIFFFLQREKEEVQLNYKKVEKHIKSSSK